MDTGLSIWEIAWLARAYEGDVEAISRHTHADPRLIEEGLRCAADHATETDAQIAWHTERSPEELLELLPGMQVLEVDVSEADGQHP